jgi:hypothetical protein
MQIIVSSIGTSGDSVMLFTAKTGYVSWLLAIACSNPLRRQPQGKGFPYN